MEGNESVYVARALDFFTFRYEFMIYALGASVMVGLVCGLVGTFLVLRGYSLVGDAIGHATLPGLAIAFLVIGYQHPVGLLVGALGSALLAAFTVGVFSSGPRVRPDAAIGIVLSLYFGVGIVLMAYIQANATGAQAGLTQFLFGNAAAITKEEFFGLSIVGVLLAVLVLLFKRPLTLLVFDPLFARSIGIPVSRFEMGLLALLSVTVVISVQAVGAILVAAMLIIPPSTARLLAPSIGGVMALAAFFGALSGTLGAMLSYVFEGVATGPAMVLVATVFFLLALFFGPRKGILKEFIALQRRRQTRKRGGVS